MKKRIFLVFTAFLLTLIVFACFFGFLDHESPSLEQISFTIDAPYLNVVQNLAKKDALEQIVKENNAILTEKKWEKFDVDVPKRLLRLKEYKISGILHFVVEKNDKFLGDLVIPFTQKIDFDKNALKIDIKSENEQKNIVKYDKNIKITPISDENKTFFEISNKLIIKNKIFFLFRDFMDKKIVVSNKKDIKQLEANLKNIINRSSDSKISIKFK